MAAKERPRVGEWCATEGNRVLFGVSYEAWRRKGTGDIRAGLRARASANGVGEGRGMGGMVGGGVGAV